MHAILHMGPPKTGTSAIQNWLLDHVAQLRKEGVLFSTNAAGKTGNAGLLIRNLIGPIENDLLPPKKDRRPDLAEDLAAFDGDTLIISAEAMFNRIMNSGDILDAADRMPRTRQRIAHLIAELRKFGVTSISAVLVMRNEADRKVSGATQRLQSMTTRFDKLPDNPTLAVLQQPYHLLCAALRDAGIEVKLIPYKDPADDRLLIDRFLETALPGRTGFKREATHRQFNVSMGQTGCLCACLVMDIADATFGQQFDKVQRSRGWAKRPLRAAYEAQIATITDLPHNGLGPQLVARHQEAQEDVISALASDMSAEQLEVLARTKWEGVQLSPQTPDDLAPQQRDLMGRTLRAFVDSVSDAPKTQRAIGLDVLAAVREHATAFTGQGALA